MKDLIYSATSKKALQNEARWMMVKMNRSLVSPVEGRDLGLNSSSGRSELVGVKPHCLLPSSAVILPFVSLLPAVSLYSFLS